MDPIETLPWVKPHPTHWRLPDLKLDYWPTKFKWRHGDVTYKGHSHFDVIKYIAALPKGGEAPKPPNPEAISRTAWWAWAPIKGTPLIWIMSRPKSEEDRREILRALERAHQHYSEDELFD